MLWKALTECNSSGMLILSGRIMRVTRRWKIEKFHGHLSTASTEADGQWGEPAWPLKREGKESKVNSPIGIFFKRKSCKYWACETFLTVCVLFHFALNLWMDHFIGNGLAWGTVIDSCIVHMFLKTPWKKKNIKWLINLVGTPPWCLNTYSLQEPPCTYLLISFYTFNFCAGLYVTQYFSNVCGQLKIGVIKIFRRVSSFFQVNAISISIIKNNNFINKQTALPVHSPLGLLSPEIAPDMNSAGFSSPLTHIFVYLAVFPLCVAEQCSACLIRGRQSNERDMILQEYFFRRKAKFINKKSRCPFLQQYLQLDKTFKGACN